MDLLCGPPPRPRDPSRIFGLPFGRAQKRTEQVLRNITSRLAVLGTKPPISQSDGARYLATGMKRKEEQKIKKRVRFNLSICYCVCN